MFISDEPAIDEISYVTNVSNYIASLCRKDCTVNLYPSLHKGFKKGGYSLLRKYFNTWASRASSKWVSSDYYPYNKRDEHPVRRAYYHNLATLTSVARKNNKKPVMITSVWDESDDKNSMYFEASTVLAFGMKAMDWFPLLKTDLKKHSWLVDKNARTSSVYKKVAEINSWAYEIGTELYDKYLVSAVLVKEGKPKTFYGKDYSDSTIQDNSNSVLFTLLKNGSSKVRVLANASRRKSTSIKIKSMSNLRFFCPKGDKWEWKSISDGITKVVDASGRTFFTINEPKKEVTLEPGRLILLK